VILTVNITKNMNHKSLEVHLVAEIYNPLVMLNNDDLKSINK